MGRPDQAEAARRFLTGLAAVMVGVAGLLLLIGPLCGDGMARMPIAGVGSSADPIGSWHDQGSMVAISAGPCDPMIVMATSIAHCASDAMSMSSSPLEAPVPGGALLACVGFVIAILAVVLALQPPRSRRAHVIQRAAETARRLVYLARRPTLAELCVLRT